MSEETKNTEEQVVATEVQETVVETVNPEQFLADFNWHRYEEGIDEVDQEKLVALNEWELTHFGRLLKRLNDADNQD